MTLVGARTVGLAGAVSADLPWVLLGFGVVLAFIGAGTVEYVTRRRLAAERLASENRELYLGQRQVAVELQEALLPDVPNVSGLQIVTRYRAGVDGTQVGGDWYDVVPMGNGSWAVIVGDVSGRGLRAASIMASLRHAIRAYLIQGDSPSVALAKLRMLLDVEQDHHFATVVIARIDVEARNVTLVSAGHFLPLIVTGDTADYIQGSIDTPIGVPSANEAVAPVMIDVAEGSKVIFFSDGLIERRGEILDDGFQRLRACALEQASDFESLIDAIMCKVPSTDTVDDTVVVGLRWTSATSSADTTGESESSVENCFF